MHSLTTTDLWERNEPHSTFDIQIETNIGRSETDFYISPPQAGMCHHLLSLLPCSGVVKAKNTPCSGAKNLDHIPCSGAIDPSSKQNYVLY